MAFLAVYDSVEQLYEEYNLLKLNGKCGVYNALENNMVITYKYDSIECIMYKSKFSELSQNISQFTGYFRVKRNEHYGLCDKLGNEILPCQYDNLDICVPYGEGLFKYCIISLGSKCGIYNLISRKDIISVYESDFDEIHDIMFLGYAYEYNYEYFSGFFMLGKNNDYGLCNEFGNNIIQCKYKKIDINNGGEYSYIISVDGKTGLYNSNKEKLIIPCQYDDVDTIRISVFFSDGTLDNIWRLRNNGKYGLHDLDNEILPCQYDTITPITRCNSDETDEEFVGCFELVQNSKFGICDSKGCIVIPCVYDSISDEGNFWKVGLHGKYGVYTKDDNNIIPCVYDEIKSVKAIINKYLQKDNYDAWGDMKNCYNICGCSHQYLVKNENMYGIYDVKQKKEIVPCKYLQIKYSIKTYNYRQNYTLDEYDVRIDYYQCMIDNQWISVYV